MTERSECLFCRIVDGDIPGEIVHTGERVVAMRDINPVAPSHVLVVSKDHHENVVEMAQDPQALAELVEVGSRIAAAESDGQFRLVFNTGAGVGQSVFHVHGHILSGRSFTWPPG